MLSHENTKDSSIKRGACLQNDAPEAVLQHRNVEIHEQPDLQSSDSQVIENLGMVDRRKAVHGLDLQHETFGNNDVKTLMTQKVAAVEDWYLLLALERRSRCLKLDADGSRTDALE